MLTDKLDLKWESPSSRRAWIEIGVARIGKTHLTSPSSRRAWIEMISGSVKTIPAGNVALLAEGVDRNNTGM